MKFTFEVGDVKTAFLEGDKSERDRNVVELPGSGPVALAVTKRTRGVRVGQRRVPR